MTGVDRDADALASLSEVARTVTADIESGPWPLPEERFDAVNINSNISTAAQFRVEAARPGATPV